MTRVSPRSAAKAWATRTLPGLKHHLDMAKALDPDIEMDAEFRLANEKCVEQEQGNREIQDFDRCSLKIECKSVGCSR